MTEEKKNELESWNVPYSSSQALVSIAISLKRIADLLEKEEQHKADAKAARKDRGERMVNLGG